MTSLRIARYFCLRPELDIGKEEGELLWERRDLILMSQSCDVVLGRERLGEVLFCAVWNRSDLPPNSHLASPKGMEDARRGDLPGFHLLASCAEPGFIREVRIVDFRRCYSLPIAYVRKTAERTPSRLRLLPPYREHLSQAYARYFMRVGLPVDIPPIQVSAVMSLGSALHMRQMSCPLYADVDVSMFQTLCAGLRCVLRLAASKVLTL